MANISSGHIKQTFMGKPVLKIILYQKGLTQGYSTYGSSKQSALAGAQFAALPLVKLVVRVACAVIN